jgi:type IV pilus biogenesis/stability protein PilW
MRPPIATTLALLAVACAHGPSAKERQSAEIHHDLGVEALGAGRAPDALREFDAALEIDPRFAEAHLGRGVVLEYGFGKLAEAEQAYRRALEIRPAYPEALNDLGQLLARTGRYEEAVRAFDEALSNMLYKEPWVARCNKGLALYRAGRRDDGMGELKACLTVNPAFCPGRRELGRILLGEGKVKEAIDELTVYARACEKNPDAHFQLGQAYMRAGDVASARERFQRCEELDPTGGVGIDCRRSRELLQ